MKITLEPVWFATDKAKVIAYFGYCPACMRGFAVHTPDFVPLDPAVPWLVGR